ncbi:hypothetical protein V9T40_011861 [Parthenolecanium corni]|uniref:Uncharacterized protein n=1 Tax=Parthenolecanium corni TaxID=536013 RepID=A0AAN9T8J5_9HEMI
MVCAEDVVSYFRTLKSYERIWMMCKLQHCCLPFELRFLGTCLEELGKKDYNELRQAENEANSNAEANLSELRRIGDARVRNKIILYLSLLHSRNYSCSNSLFKILCDCQEVNAFLKCESIASPSTPPPAPPPPTSAISTVPSSTPGAVPAVSLAASNAATASTDNSSAATSDEEEDCFEHLLMIYTLAVNHPAFSCEQKQTLQNIFEVIRAEQNKRSTLKQATAMGHALVDGSMTAVGENAVYNSAPAQIQVRVSIAQISILWRTIDLPVYRLMYCVYVSLV